MFSVHGAASRFVLVLLSSFVRAFFFFAKARAIMVVDETKSTTATHSDGILNLRLVAPPVQKEDFQ
jgi:hypothetical protein